MIPDSERRHHGRLRCSLLRCQLGTILDFSARGARIRCRRREPKVGEMILLRIHCLELAVKAWVEVVWVQRLGLMRYELGVRFTEVNTQLGGKLNEIARIAVDRHLLAKAPAE